MVVGSMRSSVLRDNLDENGSGDRECEAAAGGDPMIFSRFAFRKRVLRWGGCATDTTGAPWRADDRAACE
jgi:hypothetical protein